MSREHKKQIHAFRRQLAAKLKYLQRDGGCSKKRRKKLIKFNMIKKIPRFYFFFIEKGYFDQKFPKESEKNGLDALQQQFLA